MDSDARARSRENKVDAETVSWSEVKAVFERALELEVPARKIFLQRTCGANEKLRQEVETLLLHHDETCTFLDEPVVSVKSFLTSDPFRAEEDKEVGARLGAYRLEKVIGSGGMGEVYLATRADSEFDKLVAIKLIRDGSESETAIRRFRQERQILARLENPYIARLLDGGTTPGGFPYFVMEYVEGEAIHRYCEANSLTTRDRLSLFIKVCSAVQYAHERNIIHRDLKPGNILVKKDGTPKLLDFGIAKILGAESSAHEVEATHAAFRMLTPAYASPEQLRGGVATMRSDIYSLGVTLYEVLCGKRPDESFPHFSTSSSSQKEDHLSARLKAVVLRSVHPDPAERYSSVESFTADIRRYLSGAPPVANSPDGVDEANQQISLAVLPFRIVGDQSNTNAFLAPGITEALIVKLSRIERLSVCPPSAILKYSGNVDAVRAARELNVEYILEGSLYLLGGSVRANVQLVFAEAGVAAWAGQVEATEMTLLDLEDAIAEQVADAVLPHLTGEERAQISESGTNNGAAHAAYLRGRWYWRNSAGDREKLLKTLLCFTEAIELDPEFARAHAGIADYYLRLGLWGGVPPWESFAAAVQAAETAVKLEPTLGEAHASLAFAIWAYRRDEEAAERHFNLATVRNPNYASAHHWFGLLNSSRNRPELAIANLERAQKVDPNSVLIAAALGFVHYNARQFDLALRLLKDAARELPQSGTIQEMLTWCYLQKGETTEALKAGKRAVELGNRSSASLSALAHAQAAAGEKGQALALRDEIEKLTESMYVSGYDRASAALAVGDTQGALEHLERARDDRDWWLCWIGVDPRWDSLRGNSRFRKMLPARETRKAQKRTRLYAGSLAAVLLLAVFGWWVTRSKPVPFATARISKLTSNGTAENAAISPDARTAVFSAQDANGTSIWRKSLENGAVESLVPQLSEKVGDIDFTDGGSSVDFVTYPLKNPANRRLFKAPVTGGPVRQIGGSFPAQSVSRSTATK